MRVTFWGTRGSLAKPGRSTVRYGGNTSCVEIETSAGTRVLLDCGTGAHSLGQELIERGQPASGHILISHTHWDHIQGIPFFTPLFVEGNEWDVYGPGGLGESLEDALAGQMSYTYFPVTLSALGAAVRYHDLVEGAFQIGEVLVRTRYLNHPALTLAYRLEADGAALAYVCDHEPHSREAATDPRDLTGQDREHADFLRDADLVIHDAQYTASEYEDKVGWGHSTVEYAVAACRSVGVKRLALTHHDPAHDDDMLDRVVESLRRDIRADGPPLDVFAAAEGQVLELVGTDDVSSDVGAADPSAMRAADGAERLHLLLAMGRSPEADLVAEAAEVDGIGLTRVQDPGEIVARYNAERPSLVVLDGNGGGLEVARAIRDLEDEAADDVPLVAVADEIGKEGAVTDWLVTPFSLEYARSRLRAWALRVACRWIPAPLHAEEPARLAALRGLGLLDTAAAERFDRITRLAAGVMGVPVSLVTLIDEDRQWFKARVGTDVTETPREAAFCAHTILGTDTLVVPDTSSDDRFADNPLVAGPPHVRFYAGCPVAAPDGHAVGSLCVLDVRPRQLTGDQIGLLRDLADLVEEELIRTG